MYTFIATVAAYLIFQGKRWRHSIYVYYILLYSRILCNQVPGMPHQTSAAYCLAHNSMHKHIYYSTHLHVHTKNFTASVRLQYLSTASPSALNSTSASQPIPTDNARSRQCLPTPRFWPLVHQQISRNPTNRRMSIHQSHFTNIKPKSQTVIDSHSQPCQRRWIAQLNKLHGNAWTWRYGKQRPKRQKKKKNERDRVTRRETNRTAP